MGIRARDDRDIREFRLATVFTFHFLSDREADSDHLEVREVRGVRVILVMIENRDTSYFTFRLLELSRENLCISGVSIPVS